MQVTFEITIAEVPVPRPFLSYRLTKGGRAVGGVLAQVTGPTRSVREHFADPELTRLFRAARRVLDDEANGAGG